MSEMCRGWEGRCDDERNGSGLGGGVATHGCLVLRRLTAKPRPVASPGTHSAALPEPAPAEFTALPEWFIEDIAEFFLFLCRYEHTSSRARGHGLVPVV